MIARQYYMNHYCTKKSIEKFHFEFYLKYLGSNRYLALPTGTTYKSYVAAGNNTAHQDLRGEKYMIKLNPGISVTQRIMGHIPRMHKCCLKLTTNAPLSHITARRPAFAVSVE